MQLSENFLLSEFTRTNKNLPNAPNEAEIANLKLLTVALEKIRAVWGPLYVSSGFRSEAVNKAVGGVPTSAHRHGLAADLIPLRKGVSPKQIWDWLPTSGISFDQAGLESNASSTWLHFGLYRPVTLTQRQMRYIGTH